MGRCHVDNQIRVARDKAQVTLETLKAQALALPVGAFAFEQALAKPDLSFICECKKASPSKGLIAPEFPYLDIARAYEFAGADAISVLTEPKWFLGSDQYLSDIAAAFEAQLRHEYRAADPDVTVTVTPDQPVTPAKPEKPDTPRTGDESLLVLWMGAAALSGAAVLLMQRKKKRA